MKLHGNARLTPHGRKLLVERVCEQRVSLQEAARAAGVSTRTASKWVGRYRREGTAGLYDRSSAPHRVPKRTPPQLVRAIEALRRIRVTAAEIAEVLSLALSTVSAVLLRIGLGKRSRLQPPEPPNRYERARAGELLHIDIKKLGRIEGGAGKYISDGRRTRWSKRRPGAYGRRANQTGWEYVHVCVDDATRLAYVEVLNEQTTLASLGFLQRALAHYATYGITVESIMTDNGSNYRSRTHTLASRTLGIHHHYTKPYRPRTNGKAERFIRTLLERWAYAAIYASSHERTHALTPWLDHYNRRRPHGSLNHQPPLSRLRQLQEQRS
ncbi:MAG TPA: IS481 family transposase [Solirubrobacteraceae bacterium]|jgi:transposase InsO family protein|nr:IS481 family transposase [Solirubrobacteraceae bacterium]